MMKVGTIFRIPILLIVVLSYEMLCGAVPILLNFQGRVTVDGAVLNGTGQFKFALVSADGVRSFWSNDGSSSAGLQPVGAVTVTVTNGNYSLHLGDTDLMDPLQTSLFDNDEIFLRIWFSGGTNNGFEQLGSDHRITSVAFALQAERAKVADTVTSFPVNSIEEANLVTALREKLANLQSQINTLQNELALINNSVNANTAKVVYYRRNRYRQIAMWHANTAKEGNYSGRGGMRLLQTQTAISAICRRFDYLPMRLALLQPTPPKKGLQRNRRHAINANTAKVGYTDALVSANSDVAANTAKTSDYNGSGNCDYC